MSAVTLTRSEVTLASSAATLAGSADKLIVCVIVLDMSTAKLADSRVIM